MARHLHGPQGASQRACSALIYEVLDIELTNREVLRSQEDGEWRGLCHQETVNRCCAEAGPTGSALGAGQGCAWGRERLTGGFKRSCKSGHWRLGSGFKSPTGGCETVRRLQNGWRAATCPWPCLPYGARPCVLRGSWQAYIRTAHKTAGGAPLPPPGGQFR